MKKILFFVLFTLFCFSAFSFARMDYNRCIESAEKSYQICLALEGWTQQQCQAAHEQDVENCENNLECNAGEIQDGMNICCKDGSYQTQEGYDRGNGEICTIKYLECYDIKTREPTYSMGTTYENCECVDSSMGCKVDGIEEECTEESCDEEAGTTADTELECESPLIPDPVSNYTVCCMPKTNLSDCVDYKDGDQDCEYNYEFHGFCVEDASEAVTPSQVNQCVEQYGMTICDECLLNGQCKFNVYDALGIRKSVREKGDPTSVGLFVQDIVLSATMFIGTIVTIAIIVSGLMWISAGATGKDPTKAKSGLLNALIGLLIVVSSYLIIRLVQYIAKGF